MDNEAVKMTRLEQCGGSLRKGCYECPYYDECKREMFYKLKGL